MIKLRKITRHVNLFISDNQILELKSKRAFTLSAARNMYRNAAEIFTFWIDWGLTCLLCNVSSVNSRLVFPSFSVNHKVAVIICMNVHWKFSECLWVYECLLCTIYCISVWHSVSFSVCSNTLPLSRSLKNKVMWPVEPVMLQITDIFYTWCSRARLIWALDHHKPYIQKSLQVSPTSRKSPEVLCINMDNDSGKSQKCVGVYVCPILLLHFCSTCRWFADPSLHV